MSAPLNPTDTAILALEFQEGFVEVSKTVEASSLRTAARSLMKLARQFDIPVVVCSVLEAPLMPEIEEVLGKLDHHVHGRPTPDAFAHAPTANEIANLGRKTLLIAGVLTEVAILNTALSAVERGYHVQLVMDACGGISPRTEEAVLHRLTQAGVTFTSCASIGGQLLDTRSPAGLEALKIVFEIAGFMPDSQSESALAEIAARARASSR